MFTLVKNFFRKRSLRKYSSKEATGISPLSQIRSAVAFIMVEDAFFDECKEAILMFYKANNIKGEIFFFDFRKIGKEERLITSIKTTVLKTDLNWFGKPSREKVEAMLGSGPDLFISLIKGDGFPIEFMAKCSRAKFKIGRKQLSGNTFDLVFTEPEGKSFSSTDVFNEIKAYLKKIE